LNELVGDSAYGRWTLQIWDNRANAAVTPADAQLLDWQLQFTLQTSVLRVRCRCSQDPITITVPPGQIVPLIVNVPSWASFATNILVSASGPVDLLFNPTNLTTGAVPPDTQLLEIPRAASRWYFTIPDGQRRAAVRSLSGGAELLSRREKQQRARGHGRRRGGFRHADVDQRRSAGRHAEHDEPSERYFAFDVSSNAVEATFQLLHLSGNADLVVRKGPPLPTLISADYGSFNAGNAEENITC